MREALLIAIMLVLCPLALVRPKWGFLGYTWFALMRPDYLAWSAGEYPFSLVLAACTLAGALPRYLTEAGIWFRDKLSLAVILLTGVMGVTVFTAYSISDAWIPYTLYLRVILMAMLTPVMIQTLGDLRSLLIVMAFSIGFLGFRFGFYGLARGGARFSSGYGGFLADNNCLALAFVMVIPLCWYVYQYLAPKRIRWGFLIMAFGSFAGIVWTHSRGGAIALAVCILVMLLQSKRKLLAIGLLTLMALPAVWMAKDTYLDRLSTITEYETESSAASRLELARGALLIWRDHPVFGVGFGSVNFQRLIGGYLDNQDNHVAHNTYLQVAADSGTPALIIYVAILFGVIFRLGRSASRMKAMDRPELAAYPQSLQVALIGFAVGSAFLSRVTFDFYYMLLLAASSWFIVERKILLPQEENAQPSFSWHPPVLDRRTTV